MPLLIDKIKGTRPRDTVSAYVAKIAAMDSVHTVLLSGGFDGKGYARVLFDIALRKFQPAFLEQEYNVYVIEHSQSMYAQMRRNLSANRVFSMYNYFPVDTTLTKTQMELYYNANPTKSKGLTLQQSYTYRTEENAIAGSITNDGIAAIKEANEISTFDLVILDGTWFTGDKPWDVIIGAKYILLLDINTVKNGDMFAAINANGEYTRLVIHADVAIDNAYNNGFGVALFRLND